MLFINTILIYRVMLEFLTSEKYGLVQQPCFELFLIIRHGLKGVYHECKTKMNMNVFGMNYFTVVFDACVNVFLSDS